MITVVLTNRNRDIRIIKNCLESLRNQTQKDFDLYLVDYGSNPNYRIELEKFLNDFKMVKFIPCPVYGQLWNKSRAINIVLNQCKSQYFFVGDIDMVFHPNFINELNRVSSIESAIYFQVGFLSREESLKKSTFEEYTVAFKSNNEATGMTLYPTHVLKSINGYDEFYHGWGAEDTDVHIRLKNKGFKVLFYNQEILIKHQWHPKKYRSNASSEPFHSQLENINNQYIKHVEKFKIVEANINDDMGIIPVDTKYKELEKVRSTHHIFSEIFEIDSFFKGTIHYLPKGVYQIDFLKHPLRHNLKNKIKSWLGKKAYKFYSLEEINNKLLSVVILSFRNNPHEVNFDREKQILSFKIIID